MAATGSINAFNVCIYFPPILLSFFIAFTIDLRLIRQIIIAINTFGISVVGYCPQKVIRAINQSITSRKLPATYKIVKANAYPRSFALPL